MNSSGSIDAQTGDFLSIDLSNPSQPQLADVLFNNNGPPTGSNHNEHGAVLVNDNLAYVASTTSTGGDLQSGTGQLLIVDTSDPAHLSEVGSLDIPGTIQLQDVAISGDEALVVGNTGGCGFHLPASWFHGQRHADAPEHQQPGSPDYPLYPCYALHIRRKRGEPPQRRVPRQWCRTQRQASRSVGRSEQPEQLGRGCDRRAQYGERDDRVGQHSLRHHGSRAVGL